MKKKLSVSIVICCYNSAHRLPETIKHILNQEVGKTVDWEVIVVDNASKDSTHQTAKDLWPEQSNIPFKVVFEPQAGLANARCCGFSASDCDIISFIDDDNWICTSWVETVSTLFTENDEIGACGGRNYAVADKDFPWWFDKFQRSYAVGPQGEKTGDITRANGVVFGAGLSVRKKAWDNLTRNGFKFTLVGRKGKTLLSGEDYEICLALILSNWKIWYCSDLTLDHFIDNNRLTWTYLRSTLKSVGTSDLRLRPYYLMVAKKHSPKKMAWQRLFFRILLNLAHHPKKVFLSFFSPLEGDSTALFIERNIGQLLELLKVRKKYGSILTEIETAGWVCKRPSS